MASRPSSSACPWRRAHLHAFNIQLQRPLRTRFATTHPAAAKITVCAQQLQVCASPRDTTNWWMKRVIPVTLIAFKDAASARGGGVPYFLLRWSAILSCKACSNRHSWTSVDHIISKSFYLYIVSDTDCWKHSSLHSSECGGGTGLPECTCRGPKNQAVGVGTGRACSWIERYLSVWHTAAWSRVAQGHNTQPANGDMHECWGALTAYARAYTTFKICGAIFLVAARVVQQSQPNAVLVSPFRWTWATVQRFWWLAQAIQLQRCLALGSSR